MKNIEFIKTVDLPLEEPYPAFKSIPKWYQDHKSYLTDDGTAKPNGQGNPTATAKKCMPLFDSLTAGYIMTTSVDLYVSQQDGFPHFEWADMDYIKFHNPNQAQNYPKRDNNMPLAKIHSAWGIKTPPGYSCMILPPMHRPSTITIIPAIVDTDKHHYAIEFPFNLTNPKFEGLIPAGTEFAQIIPFKRDEWQMSTSLDTAYLGPKLYTLRKTFFNAYKTMYWSRKSFK